MENQSDKKQRFSCNTMLMSPKISSVGLTDKFVHLQHFFDRLVFSSNSVMLQFVRFFHFVINGFQSVSLNRALDHVGMCGGQLNKVNNSAIKFSELIVLQRLREQWESFQCRKHFFRLGNIVCARHVRVAANETCNTNRQ